MDKVQVVASKTLKLLAGGVKDYRMAIRKAELDCKVLLLVPERKEVEKIVTEAIFRLSSN